MVGLGGLTTEAAVSFNVALAQDVRLGWIHDPEQNNFAVVHNGWTMIADPP
jgi:hypothetical protein